MKPKIHRCPDCKEEGKAWIAKGRGGPYPLPQKVVFRVRCECGRRGPWARSVRRAVDAWNETADLNSTIAEQKAKAIGCFTRARKVEEAVKGPGPKQMNLGI